MRGRRSRIVLGAAYALLVACGAAQAAEDGFYIGTAAGVNFTRDSKFSLTGSQPTASYDTGFAGLASAGYGLGSGLRFEGELGFRDNDIDDIAGISGAGDVSALTIMGNVLYDIDLGGRLTPYVGIGAGLAQVDFDGANPVGGSTVNDDDTAFAYQGIVGAAYEVSDRFKLTLDYRYLAAPNLELMTNSGASADSKYRSHSVMLGLRFSFGAAAPAPASTPPPQPAQAPVAEPEPAPQPAPAVEPPPPPVVRNFLVFFDFDKSALTPEAMSIVASAADAAKQAAPIRIELTGHADRSGPRSYNQGLSQRRADAVSAELTRLGIPPADIGISARGEDDPLVLTPDGVREPQNRRVEIFLQ